jgi:hypothetical protein
MSRNVFCRGVVAFALTVTLGVPGIAAAESADTELTVAGLGVALWDFLTGGFLDESTSTSGGTDTGGGDTKSGGGAMDPNGGGTGGTPISPKP